MKTSDLNWSITLYGQFEENNRSRLDGYYTRDEAGTAHTTLPTTIGEALRNYLVKGWTCEVLAVEHKPKHMSFPEWDDTVTSSYHAWVDHIDAGTFGDGC